jgi:hypothetical protein
MNFLTVHLLTFFFKLCGSNVKKLNCSELLEWQAKAYKHLFKLFFCRGSLGAFKIHSQSKQLHFDSARHKNCHEQIVFLYKDDRNLK